MATDSLVLELPSEFFHCCILAGNFTSLSTVQSYLCVDCATENSLINLAKRPRQEASEPVDPGWGMSVKWRSGRAATKKDRIVLGVRHCVTPETP